MSYYYSHEHLNTGVRTEQGVSAQFSELNLFGSVPTQREVEKVFWEQIFCKKGGIDLSQRLVQFDVGPMIELIDLCDSFMEAKINLRRKSGATLTKPTAAMHVAPVNCILYNLFKGEW